MTIDQLIEDLSALRAKYHGQIPVECRNPAGDLDEVGAVHPVLRIGDNTPSSVLLSIYPEGDN